MPCGVCGRNTENLIKELDLKTANYKRKRYVVMKYIHDEKHIVFNDVGKGRRRMGVLDEVEVIMAIVV